MPEEALKLTNELRFGPNFGRNLIVQKGAL